MTGTAASPSPDSTVAELAAIMEQRASTYDLLSRLYRVEVGPELLDELKRRSFPTDTGNESIDRGYLLITTFLSNAWENSLTDLAIDYVRVFIGHGMDMYAAAYPYESVHTSKKRLLMQEARDEVLTLYHAAGIVKDDSWKEGEDHIALELEYMQILARRTADALTRQDEHAAVSLLTSQRNFLEDHLAAWAPMMTTEMKRLAKTDLYQGLAWLTEGYLEEDRAFLNTLLDEEGPVDTASDLQG